MKFFNYIASLYKRNSILRFLPGILYMLLIIYLSSQSTGGKSWLVPPMDKVVHFAVYGIFSILLTLWIPYRAWEKFPWISAFAVLGIVAIFGLSDEIHQSFVPYRDASMWDLLADISGGLTFVLIFMLALKVQAKRIRKNG